MAAEIHRGTYMKFRLVTALVCALVIAGIGSAGMIGTSDVAFAQDKKKADAKKKDAAPAADQPQTQRVGVSPWTKICEPANDKSKGGCTMFQQLGSETGQLLAVAQIIEEKAEKGTNRAFRINLPLGFALQPGIRIIIDKFDPIEGKYVICVQGTCIAESAVTEAFVNELKKGKVLTVQVVNMENRVASLHFDLSTFAKSYDGPPVDPKELQAKRKALDNAVQNEAKDVLKQHLEKNKK
jgi:invasion protein IalB